METKFEEFPSYGRSLIEADLQNGLQIVSHLYMMNKEYRCKFITQ